MFVAVVNVGFYESAVFAAVSGVNAVVGVAAEVESFQQVLIALGDVDIYCAHLIAIADAYCSRFVALIGMIWNRSTR